MIYKLCWFNSLPLIVGGLLLSATGVVNAAEPASETGLTTRGPAGTVKITPQLGDATPKPASMPPTPQAAEVKPLNFKVNYVYRPGGQGALKPLVEGSALNSGDHYKVQFTPEEDSYVYIFQVDSSKAIFQLFPMRDFGGVRVDNFNPVKAGVVYHLPAKDKSFQLDNNVGSESILFLAFRQRNQALEEQYEALIKARMSKDKTTEDNLQTAIKSNFKTRGLAGIVDDPQKKTATVPWTSAESFTVPVRHLNNLCADCISMITFEHR
ncbi:MAG: DUF4384 domain-containing protein [Candidatus Competibacteraceae bacterium]|nr:DUF4384 domain-containing protein [Candidatus Competibacteraceae bacterium]